MEYPLSRREWKLYKELKNLFSDNKQQVFEHSQYHKYMDWLEELSFRGVLDETRFDGGVIYYLRTSFADFELWLIDQNKKSKRVSKREWRIGVVSAIIGAVLASVTPIIIQYLLR